MLAKPAVDGIERAAKDRATMYRIATTTASGAQVAQYFGIRGVPTLVLLDGKGEIVFSQSGRIDKDAVLAALQKLE
ncbi:MAG: thioredoxin family protein [Anaerolineae bacterium]